MNQLTLDEPIICTIDRHLTQEDIDGVKFEIFPKCNKCNPDGFVISW